MELEELRVAVVGHSYVRRLKSFIEADDDVLGRVNMAFDLYRENVAVKFFFKSGCDIEQFHSHLKQSVLAYHPKIVIVILGGNDLDDDETDPVGVAADIVQLAEEFQSNNNFVIISQILDRPQPRIPADIFKIKARICNSKIVDKIQHSNKIIFWTHIRLNNCNTHMHRDGVHLNNKGNFLYYKSLKRALSHVLSHVANGTGCTCPAEYPGPRQRARAGRRHRRR